LAYRESKATLRGISEKRKGEGGGEGDRDSVLHVGDEARKVEKKPEKIIGEATL